jgi:hypothetical protein
MRATKVPAIFTGIKSRKDRSYSLTFETREFSGSDAAELLALQQTEGWLLFAPTDDIDEAVIPAEKANAELGSKTPGQRLRGVLFILWQQTGKGEDFEDFYRKKMEAIIDQVKARLDAA